MLRRFMHHRPINTTPGYLRLTSVSQVTFRSYRPFDCKPVREIPGRQYSKPYQLKPLIFTRRHCHERHSLAAKVITMPAAPTDGGAVLGLKPKQLWTFFNQLSQIPRPSKHEHQCVTLSTSVSLPCYDMTINTMCVQLS